MEEIKEILGPEHVIYQITEELVDLEEETDILEKIGCLIDSVDNSNGKAIDTMKEKEKQIDPVKNETIKETQTQETNISDQLLGELLFQDVTGSTTISLPNSVPNNQTTAQQNSQQDSQQDQPNDGDRTLRHSGPTNPFIEQQVVGNIGWTDWIRSFVIYTNKKNHKNNHINNINHNNNHINHKNHDKNHKHNNNKLHEIKPSDYELSYEELQSATRNRSALPRLLPDYYITDDNIYRVPEKEPKQIIFGGCAGMYHYFLGIASVLQEKFDMSDVIFGCVSGGSFPALALILDLPVKELHESWNKEILQELNKSSLKAFSRLNGIVFEKSKKYIPIDAHIKAKDRLFISLTEFPSLKNHIVHYWQTIDSLLDCIQASCFIPIFDTRFWTIFDKTKYVDGGLSNNKPVPYPHSPYIYITTDRWREIPLHWYWCYTSETWSDQLFAWGAEDTLAHLDEFQFLSARKS